MEPEEIKIPLSDDDRLYLEDLKEHGVKLEKNCFYTMQRMDILIIVLSTSGILLLINLTETLYKYQIFNVAVLKLCISFFIVSIVLNLLSQSFAYTSNDIHRKINDSKIYKLKYEKIIDDSAYAEKRKKASRYGKSVRLLNYLSLISLIVALILSTVSFWLIA